MTSPLRRLWARMPGGRGQKVPAADERPESGGVGSPSDAVAIDQPTGAPESGRRDAAAAPEPTATLTSTATAPSDQTITGCRGRGSGQEAAGGLRPLRRDLP